MRSVLACGLRTACLVRSIKTALLVGTIIGLINYGDLIIAGAMSTTAWVKLAVTYLVPFCVATVAAGAAVAERELTESQRQS